MGFTEDLQIVFKFSTSWRKESWFMGIFAILAAIGFLTGAFSGFIRGGSSALVLLLVPIALIAGALFMYFEAKIILAGLKKNGFGNIEFGIGPFVSYVIMTIVNGVSTLFPWTDMKLLAASIILSLGLLATGVGILISVAQVAMQSNGGGGEIAGSLMATAGTALLFFILLVPSILLWIYAGTRLYASRYVFLGGKGDIVGSIKKSWELTNGRFWQIFGLNAAFNISWGIVLGIAAVILALPAALFNVIGISAISVLLAAIADGLLGATRAFIYSYGGVGIYSLIDRPIGNAPAPPPEEPRPSPLFKPKKEMVYDQN